MIIMNFCYYYSVVMHLIIFSNLTVEYWNNIMKYYTDFEHNFSTLYDWQTSQLSMDFEYYNI